MMMIIIMIKIAIIIMIIIIIRIYPRNGTSSGLLLVRGERKVYLEAWQYLFQL